MEWIVASHNRFHFWRGSFLLNIISIRCSTIKQKIWGKTNYHLILNKFKWIFFFNIWMLSLLLGSSSPSFECARACWHGCEWAGKFFEWVPSNEHKMCCHNSCNSRHTNWYMCTHTHTHSAISPIYLKFIIFHGSFFPSHILLLRFIPLFHLFLYGLSLCADLYYVYE